MIVLCWIHVPVAVCVYIRFYIALKLENFPCFFTAFMFKSQHETVHIHWVVRKSAAYMLPVTLRPVYTVDGNKNKKNTYWELCTQYIYTRAHTYNTCAVGLFIKFNTKGIILCEVFGGVVNCSQSQFSMEFFWAEIHLKGCCGFKSIKRFEIIYFNFWFWFLKN